MSCEGCRGRKGLYVTDNPVEINNIVKNKGFVEGKPRAISVYSFVDKITRKKKYFVIYKLSQVNTLASKRDAENLQLVWNV